MNYAHSFWSKPLFNNKFNNVNESVAITLIDYALSVDYLHKNGYEVTLYADKEGAELLSVIPYDKVVIVDNYITDNWHFAASMKFVALEQMPLGDVLIDGDMFLTKGRIYAEIASSTADLTCSFFEPYEKDAPAGILKYKPLFDYLDECDLQEPFKSETRSEFKGWYNTSLIRFQNQKLRDAWIKQYKEHVSLVENKEFPIKVWPDVILEQLHLTHMITEDQVKCIVPKDIYYTPEGEDYCNKIGFTHLGIAKKRLHNNCVRLLYKQNKELFLKINDFIRTYGENYLHKATENA